MFFELRVVGFQRGKQRAGSGARSPGSRKLTRQASGADDVDDVEWVRARVQWQFHLAFAVFVGEQ